MTSTIYTRTFLRRQTVLAAAIVAIGLAGAEGAVADSDPVDLTVVDRETGQPLQTWRHHDRLFVAGQPGARYGLRVTNHTDGRVLVVMSVDGVNIITGETASYGQRGYVFNAYQSYDVTGWRKSNTEVAAFTFAPLPQSYASRTGRPNDVGVIGMAVFKEKVAVALPAAPEIRPDWREGSAPSSFSATNAPAARHAAIPPPPGLPPPPPPPLMIAPTPSAVVTARRVAPAPSVVAVPNPLAGDAFDKRQDEKLGTAHGAREWSVSNTVTFERATPYPQSLRQIEYDTYDNLVASGVIPSAGTEGHRPRPFPSKPDETGYVPDPPSEP